MEPRRQAVPHEIALASEKFDQFCSASTFKTILGHYRDLCELLSIKPTAFPSFYPKLKSKLRSWKAQALWAKFDKRASHKCYNRGKACPNTRVLIIGAGPCGLRSAIEAQLLGAKVVVVEKRDRITRHNVLHLWPFVIHDLRALGAKKFFGKFCAGSIDHISIRQLQCILLKVALILGVEIHEGVGFENLVAPPPEQAEEKIGWRANVSPSDHPVSQYEFDVLIGADGKRNTLEGFKRKEFRGKLAIAITANFINRHSEAEARVEEISGVAFIFNQKFFKDLHTKTRIDLENIVYYKDETHYFVMTAKKLSLIDKGVILNDFADTAKLLAPENVDKDKLQDYAREAADFSTNYKLPRLEFALNGYGQPDVAMFDFTSMFAAENACRVIERQGHRLLQILVGDSLLEPFWPTGSGCARGFLSSMDACWAIRSWSSGQATPLEVLAERESIYRLLGQTTPENLQRDYASYTLDPHTRYPNLNSRSVMPVQVKSLFDSDDPTSIELHLHIPHEMPVKRRRKDSQVHPDTLLLWLKKQVALYSNIQIENMSESFKNGLALCAIIHRYRPDLIDFHSLKPENIAANNQLAFDTLERELGIPPVMTGSEMEDCDVPDKLTMLSYLSQIYDTFRGEIPHIRHPKLEPELDDTSVPSRSVPVRHLTKAQKLNLLTRLTSTPPRHSAGRKRNSTERDITNSIAFGYDRKIDLVRKGRNKRRSLEKDRTSIDDELQKRLEEVHKSCVEREKRKRYLNEVAAQHFYKSMQMLQTNAKQDGSEPFDDYNLFIYRMTAPDFADRVKDLERKLLYPDREDRIRAEVRKAGTGEDMTGRIKTLEEKLRGTAPDKKPKDLLRAIGKIDKTDWNVQELEKKIHENKMGRGTRQEQTEKVPKWSRDQFVDKFEAVKSKLVTKDPEKVSVDKFAEIDNNLKRIDQKLKEGTALDMGPRGSNKVSAMADKFAIKPQEPDKQSIQRSNSRAALILPAQGGSEICHFCDKRVYVMERLSAEGKFFHRGCFRCEYCGTTLRLGNHTFDRDGKYGSRFYCAQHFGMPGVQGVKLAKKGENGRSVGKENIPMKPAPDSIDKASSATPGRKFDGMDVLDQRTTPERIEFENLITSDIEEPPGEMDEDEWTDRNFGTSAAEYSSSSSSDLSESDDEANEVFEEAVDHPLTSDETRILAENWSRKYSKNNSEKLQNGNSSIPKKEVEEDDESASLNYGESDEDLSYKEYESDDDDSETATEGEDDIKARELRKQEVCLENLHHVSRDSDTGSDTEVQSEDTTDSDDVIENSATEIETDSEFEHDGTTLHSIPPIKIDDRNVTKRRGYVKAEEPIKVQARTGHITKPMNGTLKGQPCQPAGRQGIKLQFSPLKQETEAAKSASLSNLTVGKNIINSNTKIIPMNIPKPLINPRQGDYLLNRTHSTEGIASKLSLELKKKYLLGPSQMGGSVKKSGSASTIDSKLKNFVDVISEHQKLLNPAPEPSPSMQAFLQGTANLRTSSSNGNPLSPASPTVKQLSFLPLSPQQVANLRKQKELPDDVEKFEHICSLGKSIDHKTESENNKNKLNDSLLEVNTVDNSEIPGGNTVMLDIANANDKDLDKGNAHSEQESDCRPRSPVHETSIVVPNIPWKTNHDGLQEADSDDIESDSLSSSSCSSNTDEESKHKSETSAAVITTPRVEIHNSSGELMADDSSDIGAKVNNEESKQVKEKIMDIPIKATTDFNFPANLETNETELLQKTTSVTSDHSSPSTPPSTRGDDSESLCNEGTFAAFTETELSDWAQEGVVSADDLDDAEFNIDSQFINFRHKKSKSNRNFSRGLNTKSLPRKALGEDFEDDPGHVCGRKRKDDDADGLLSLPPPMSLFANFDNIEFMDTGEENGSDSDEPLATANRAILKNSGYVQFVDNDDLSTPVADVTQFLPSPVLPTVVVSECDEIEPLHTIEVIPNLEAINKELVSISGEEEESSLQPDGTTTEDTTTSEIVTIKDKLDDSSEQISENDIFYTPKDNNEITSEDLNVDEYKEYTNQIQDFVSPFYNVRDSIDIRKSHQKNKIHQNQKNIRVQEDEHSKTILKEKSAFDVPNNIQSPTLSKKLEEISKERSKQKDLIQQLVLDKHLSQRKLSQERKNKKGSLSPNSATGPSNVISPVLQMECPHSKLSPKVPVSVKKIEMPTVILPCTSIEEEVKQLNNRRHSIHDAKVPLTDDTPLVTKENEQFFTPFSSIKILTRKNRPLSYHSSFRTPQKPENFRENVQGRYHSPLPDTPLTNPEAFSLPDIRKALFLSPDAPIAPPRTKHERTKEDLKQTTFLTNDNELFAKSSATVKQTDASYLNSNYFGSNYGKCPQFSAEGDVPTMTSPSSPTSKNVFFLKRDLGELDVDSAVLDKKKHKDSDRRRSIIQAVSDFFKKKDSAGSPSPPKTPTSNIHSAKEGKFRLKFKSKGKLAYSSCSDDSDDKNSPSKLSVSPNEDKMISRVGNENNLLCDDTAPPPIPPPPKNYLECVLSARDGEDFHSELDEDSRITAPSTPSHETGSSVSSLNRRHSRMQLRLSRQAQQKRLRMAQEVQRQLEELEVKQKELEQRGVCVEKALRGEGSDMDGRREEADLLKEWFELVRERSELRRYERELLIRAEDLELEDRHTRLQQELREMLQKDDANKSHDDVEQEGRILEEMLEIVERRDSLIALLEEDRQRYQEEDKDLEAQMLAKGLRLTPLRKESDV